MQAFYTSEKVNNEIELCEVMDEECRKLIEKSFLRNRISYYMRWRKASVFRRHEICIICVNDTDRELAEQVIADVCRQSGYSVKLLMKKSSHSYL